MNRNNGTETMEQRRGYAPHPDRGAMLVDNNATPHPDRGVTVVKTLRAASLQSNTKKIT